MTTPAPDSSGYIHANFSYLEQGAQDLASVQNALVAELESLEADLRSRLVWTSSANDYFEAAKRVWQGNTNDMAVSMAGFSQFVGTVKDHYINTENRNAGIWGAPA
jgi:hypothetical protein